MDKKKTLGISPLALSLFTCQDDDTVDILDVFSTPPALTKISVEEFLNQGEQMSEDDKNVDDIVSTDRAFYVD